MKNYIILSEKPWHKEMFQNLQETFPDYKWNLITSKVDFQQDHLIELKPDKIFIPHWSYIIPKAIYENYECVVFHMTDLPYGRGGSPLQNLILRAKEKTKISALKVQKGLDTGPVYLKKDMMLYGTAQEIFIRTTAIVEEMIKEIIHDTLEPQPQSGKITEFKRRRPEDGDISKISDIDKIYDFIRMLDCEGYPAAFFENEHFRFEFSRASLKSENKILADVRIIKK
ncbi:formyltransferase family protein [Autumnicola edwardsiae]|uniref:Methionyl-tRNA formyltransferase n=1 Tax=Autumnicola edwardsiae TaxID=3075594 RepID=A0ABU3CTF8_9FLAO|nr:formyltransferase family protein [Zunongwangia sp. F297]MDT0649644.1 methionyl-tRNA formyltransferase [Zunongwangia sp. F297]